MANTQLVADVVAKIGLPIPENELGWINTLYRADEDEFSSQVNGYKKGATIRTRRPADFVLRTGATVVTQDVIEVYTALTVDQQVGVGFEMTSADQALKDTDMAERILKPAMSTIANGIMNDVATERCGDADVSGRLQLGGHGRGEINSFADFSVPAERMDLTAIPQDKARYPRHQSRSQPGCGTRPHRAPLSVCRMLGPRA